MNGLEAVGAFLICMLVGFGMGREWQRVFGKAKNDCPFGADCVPCNQQKWATRVHVRYEPSVTTCYTESGGGWA